MPVDLRNVDIDTNREELVNFLRGQDTLKDYAYDGSNMALLLDLLAHDKFGILWYVNMAIREGHSASAVLRNSIVSHAKSNNYLPQSMSSSVAVVSFVIPSGDVMDDVATILLPKSTEFRATVAGNGLLFTTNGDLVRRRSPNGDFVFSDIRLFEGTPVFERFVVRADPSNPTDRFALTNGNADMDSLEVKVREDSGASVPLPWNRYLSAADMKQNTRGYFVVLNREGKYEIQFGDGNIGRALASNNVVEATYRATRGSAGNGAESFTLSVIPGRSGSSAYRTGFSEEKIAVATVDPSSGGGEQEETESIRRNTIQSQSAQNRMVIEGDFRALLKQRFGFLRDVHVYGGQKAVPPRFGKVILVLEHRRATTVSENEKKSVVQYCGTKMSPVLSVIIEEPENLFIDVAYKVDYIVGETPNPESLRGRVSTLLGEYARKNVNGFGRIFLLSQMTAHIVDSFPEIAGAQAEILLSRKWEDLAVGQTFRYDNPINPKDAASTVYSTPFRYQGQPQAVFADDRRGNIDIVFVDNAGARRTLGPSVGKVDYSGGVVTLNHLPDIVAVQNDAIFVYAKPADDAIAATQSRLLTFNQSFVVPRPLVARG